MSLLSDAINPYRLYIEIGGAVLLVTTSVALWVNHDHKQQNIGAQKCIEQTTVTKQEAQIDVNEIEQKHADQLRAVSDAYVAQLVRERASSADLAERLRRLDTVRPSAMPGIPAAAGDVCATAVDAATRRIEAEHADSFAACLANQDEVTAIRTAWQALAQKR